jgi:hypothetical protein
MTMSLRPRVSITFVALLLVTACWPAGAAAQGPSPDSLPLETLDEPPPGYELTGREAIRAADRHPDVLAERAEHGPLRVVVGLPSYGPEASRSFTVTYLDRDGDRRIVADLVVNGTTGEVTESWTGPQAASVLARGYQPPMGRGINKPYVWLPLAALFLLPFLDPRRPFRLLHLDLLVLLGFGVSQVYFNRGDVEVSVPAVYPLLAYLLVRALYAGFRPRDREDELIPYARVSWLVAGLVLLVAFRMVFNFLDSHVIDAGYASVVGADRIMHGEELYVLNDVHGDTYGPLNYVAYVPFEALFPWGGLWDSVWAAHAAAITFDLAVIVLLMVLGTRLRSGAEGRKLGLALGYAWAAFPFTLYVLQTNTNDGLVAALLLAAVLMIGRPMVRGMMVGVAAAVKFVPLAMAPLLATGLGTERRTRAWPAFAAGLAGVLVLSVAVYLPDGGLREFYDTTLGYQLSRGSAFSPWGQNPSLEWLQELLKAGAVLLAAVVAFVPARRSLSQVCALGAAVMIAVQLPSTHWFYFYVVWFTPLLLPALFSAYSTSARGAGALDGWTRSRAPQG